MLKIKKLKPIYRLFFLLSKKRKIQIWFLIFFQLMNGILEFFSISAIVPFLSIFVLNNDMRNIPIVGSILISFGIDDISKSFFIITFFFCLFILLSTFFRIFNLRYTYKLAANIEIELSKKIFKDNILQPYISYTQKNSSDFISITTEKVSSTTKAFSSFLLLTGSLILGIFIVISLLVINWQIISIASIFLLFYYLIIYKKVSKTLYKNGKSIASISPIRLRLIQEVFLGFRDIVVNGTENIYIELFNKFDSEYKLRGASTRFISIFPRYLIEGILIFILAISGYNLYLLNFNLINFIPIFGSAIYAFQKLLPLIQLAYATWADYSARYHTFIEVLFELESNKSKRKRKKTNDDLLFNNSVELKNIYFGYDSSNYILQDINFIIKKGEHIGIFGETGSGKSTLLDIIIGLLPPSKGDILIDDQSLYKKDSNSNWTSKIAHVSQNIFLKEGSIAENIAYGQSSKEFDLDLLIKASRMAQIYDFIQQTEKGFDTNVGERGIRLSGGQRQRITIARAIYKSREILVLDEATSALDDKTEELIIESLKRDKNLTIIMVTHRLKSLRICDRVFNVEKSKLFEEKNY
tara:strand:+ start:5778 stop:7523 length:1746 start_codon:yes stop_codon:yes gene_type:complete